MDVHGSLWHAGCREELKPRVYETQRPMQAWSLALEIGQLLVTRTLVREASNAVRCLSTHDSYP